MFEKLEDIRQKYEQIRARWPNNRDALANQSLTLLTLGDLERGDHVRSGRGPREESLLPREPPRGALTKKGVPS